MKKLNCVNCKKTKCHTRNAKLQENEIKQCFEKKTLLQRLLGK